MITTIFFDLGNVLIDFSHAKLAHNISKISHLSQTQAAKLLTSFTSWDPYELGLIDTEEFYLAFKSHFHLDCNDASIAWACCDIFSPNQDSLDLLTRCHLRDFKLGLISNTSHLHFEYLKKTFPIFHVFDTKVLSYELKIKKPNIEIFQHALCSIASPPEACVFIDDIAFHVEAAKACGIQGIVFKNASLLEKEFSVLGIHL